ncbi:DUF4185 domain-containing protein [Nocardioides campestrisoli]|uniref:DUF4185 domain-containing protein n=1 Tax=Nocardioides campestrisoli TaxID=2736757 RepID=UPI0015E6C7EA|nr:DUF4185 domain-containing protein [Nocardioides campestrisoli]
MSRLAHALPPRVLVLSAALLLVPGVLLALLIPPAADPRLHEAPFSIVAPGVVSSALVDRADALPGAPLAGVPATSEDDALRDVAAGRVVGALVMDLASTEDELVLNDRRAPQLNEAVEEQVRQVLRANGRTLRVSTTSLSDVPRTTTSALGVAASVLGILVAMVVSLLFGPAPARLRSGVRRVAALAVGSLVVGAVAAWVFFDVTGAQRAALAGVLGAAMLLPATLTLALGALLGLGGMALSVSLFVVLSAPLLLGVEASVLPQPWRLLEDWSPSGATRQALEGVALFGGAGAIRAALVLGAWFALAALAMVAARRERARSAADPSSRTSRPPRVRGWRLRVAAVVLPSAAVLALVLTLVAPGDLPAAAPVPDGATQTRCVATGGVDSVQDLNRISRKVRGSGVFRGGDVGASGLLQDGRRVIVFGDTLRRFEDGAQTFVRNSMLLLGPDCIQGVLPADGGAVIPDRPRGPGRASVGYWPMSVNVSPRPGYDLVAVAAQRVRTTGEGPFDFEVLGGAVAVFIVAPGRAPQLVSVTDLGPDRADPTRPVWGAASVVRDGWAYVYGTASSGEELTFGYSLRLARVRPEQVQDLGAWRYWDGRGWSRSEEDAVELIPAQGGTSQTLSVFERNGTWYAVSKRDDFLGSEVAVWSAPDPWGPFDDGRPVAPLPSNVETGHLRYMPLAHPDLLPEPDSVVVSYSRNRTSVGEVLADPMEYRPRFIRVPLP